MGKGCVGFKFHLSVRVYRVINDHHGAEFRGKWEFHKIGTLFLAPIVSTCYVPSREVVAGRNEVEFLRGFHSVPAQITASRGRDWGGPVFDSPMLKLALSYLGRKGVREESCVSTFYGSLCLFYRPRLGTLALVSNVGLLASLCGVSPFGGVLPLE